MVSPSVGCKVGRATAAHEARRAKESSNGDVSQGTKGRSYKGAQTTRTWSADSSPMTSRM